MGGDRHKRPFGNPHRTDLSEISYLDPSGLRLFKPLAAIRLFRMSRSPANPAKIHVVTYADDTHGVRGGLYVARQEAIRRDVERHGLASCMTYNFKDLQDCPEYKADPEYFALHPFANGHAFKPVILRKALESIKDGEYLFYYDASKFLPGRTIGTLRKLCDVAGGALTWQYGDPNVMWVKRAVFEACGDPELCSANAPHLATTWFLFKVDHRFRQFMDIWARINCRSEVAEEREFSHSTFPSSVEMESARFVDNRGDQSIFSVLCGLQGYTGFFGAGYGLNRSLRLFGLSMWIGSTIFKATHRTRALALG
jgi:hypothetical protein